MRFIDLFSGLGGFHLGLSRLGHRMRARLRDRREPAGHLQKKHFGITPKADHQRHQTQQHFPSTTSFAREVPCQPFSKAGEQQGLDCPKWGRSLPPCPAHPQVPQTSIYYSGRKTFPNLRNAARQRPNWRDLEAKIQRAGYSTDSGLPKSAPIGIPQIRGAHLSSSGSRDGLGHFRWPVAQKRTQCSPSIRVLDKNPSGARPLSPQVIKCLEVWQRFVQRFPKETELPSFPIWSIEFGATYPYKQTTPWVQRRNLVQYRGNHGRRLRDLKGKALFSALPSHARPHTKPFRTGRNSS